MVSSLTAQGAKESMLALKYGAVDVVAKPHGTHSIGLTAQADELVAKVLAAASVAVEQLVPLLRSSARQKPPIAVHKGSAFPVVIIASLPVDQGLCARLFRISARTVVLRM